ncbi:MAG: hypothetical protein AAGC60_08300 [Acidobacteriota bacterium]
MIDKLVHVRGNVSSSGEITAGSGFRVVRDRTGIFQILLDRPFADTPTVTATVISNSARDDKTRVNAVVQRDGLQSDRFIVITGDDDGDLDSKDFGFIAVGPG